MTGRIRSKLQALRDKAHHRHRGQPVDWSGFAATHAAAGAPDLRRSAMRLAAVLARERPIVHPDDRICFLRTVPNLPDIFTPAERTALRRDCYVHELGTVSNLAPDYASILEEGLLARRRQAVNTLRRGPSKPTREFFESVVVSIDSVLDLATRYAAEAQRVGNPEAAAVLRRVPAYGARSFREALQSFRVIHFALWVGGSYHNTVGRFDQFAWPYLQRDLADCTLDEPAALELLEEFFLSFNLDSDLYPGMQQGDNGQSLVIGGVDANGDDAYNPLSAMCLRASLELGLIDPKINLRVHAGTPVRVYETAAELTRQGLGFPQYSNDDVVIPRLVDLGYDLSDARDYVVAACWEFIVPGKGMEIPNIGAVSYLKAVDEAVRTRLRDCRSFGELMAHVERQIHTAVDRETARFENVYFQPAPFLSLLMDGCMERGRDVSLGAKYNNFGLHGTGLANAADSLAAVSEHVFERGTLDVGTLLAALEANFEGYEDLRLTFEHDAPKMGNDDARADTIAVALTAAFAGALADKRNEGGGRYRAGTGSAMYYVAHGRELGATPDGRRRGESLSANCSPSLGVKTRGPLSVFRSVAKLDPRALANGGPLTLELHDSVFRNPEGVQKTARLVMSFAKLGGHQLQINAVNRDVLLDAQKRPERHRDLIVRVWGWSGYFVELEKQYQDQIIRRTEYRI